MNSESTPFNLSLYRTSIPQTIGILILGCALCVCACDHSYLHGASHVGMDNPHTNIYIYIMCISTFMLRFYCPVSRSALVSPAGVLFIVFVERIRFNVQTNHTST